MDDESDEIEDLSVVNDHATECPDFYHACRKNEVNIVKALINKAQNGVNLATSWGNSFGDGCKMPLHEVNAFTLCFFRNDSRISRHLSHMLS